MACDEVHIDACKYGDVITLLPDLLPAGAYHALRTVIASNFMRDLASPS